MDIDEFVVSPKPLLSFLTEDDSCAGINRIHLFCSNCTEKSDKENIIVGNNEGNWLQVVGDPKFDHPKLLVDPDKTECLYVHFSVCGKPCKALDEKSAHILHFINFFERRNSLLSVLNTSSFPVRSSFVSEFTKNHSGNFGKGHLKGEIQGRSLLSDDPSTIFHLIWTTSAEYFKNWRLFILLSIQRAHRHIPLTIRIYSNTLTINDILKLPDAHLLNTSVI
jgi:hypothetical protein